MKVEPLLVWLGRAATTFALLAAVMFVSRLHLGAVPTDGVIRLAWRVTGNKVEVCRDRSEEELAKLPPHMRKPRVCSNHALRYRLEVDVDGRTVQREELTGAGLRGDRPLYVTRDVAVSPGQHRLHVRLTPIGTLDESEMEDSEAMGAEAMKRAANVEYRSLVQVEAGRVALLGYDAERGPVWVE